MRTIKFRAWDNDKMHYQVRCGGVFDGIPTAPTVWNEKIGWVNLTGQPYSVIMQFTGLKDQKGNEIFEGDILEIYPDRILPQVVTFEEGMFCTDEFALFELTRNKERCFEVIGNIYENPELLVRV